MKINARDVAQYFLIVALFQNIVVAGGPLATVNGTAVRYNSASPVTYKTDLGALGSFSNTVATNLASTSFQTWQDVTTANITFTNGGQLPVDVNSTNYLTYLNNTSDGINPIIFDSDGSIVNALFGAGSSSSIIGFAGSSYFTSGPNVGFFSEGRAVMNGAMANNPFTETQFKATFIHEFGHFIGLDHAQLNSQFAGDGNSANDVNLPTMFPTSTDDDTYLNSLNPDDIAAVSLLYPEATFGSATGKISGSVVRFDNSVVRGANVVAISTGSDSLFNQISTVTDYYVQNNGNFTIVGLAPGNYFVKIEPVRNSFTSGSSVGPYAESGTDLSFINPVLQEYYNGNAESSDPATDQPSLRTVVSVAAAATTSNINFVANKEPNVPITNILEYHGTAALVFKLPSRFDDKRYAVRFTPGANATFVRTEFMLNGASNAVLGTGTLKVSVHQHSAGSVGGVPGTQIGTSVTIPFSQLTKGAYNIANFAAQNIPLQSNVNFHVVFEVVGVSGDTLQFVADDATNETNRSSSYFNAGTGAQWYNLIDPDNYTKGYNLAIRAVIDIPNSVNTMITLLPDAFSLDQNYPNPFNPTTTISFTIPNKSFTTLKVFSILGEEVATIVNGELEPGQHSVQFNASNLASGLYFYSLGSNSLSFTKKMLLIR
jgi:hypothetical protein